MLYSDELGLPTTDAARWRLFCDELGAERWEYLDEQETSKVPQTTFVQWLLKVPSFPTPQPEVSSQDEGFTAADAAYNGARFLGLLQDEASGIFPCQYKGPMFMTIGYVVAMHVGGVEIPEEQRRELVRYVVNTAHPVDGGWGLHSEDKSTVMGTVLNYVLLRLLGMEREHVVMQRARKTLLRMGGAIGAPYWAKVWLAVLNLYKWEGVNPAPAELWLLPYQFPYHPARWWVHTRAIFLPMSYLAGARYQCALTPLLEELRTEIFTKPFDEIDFAANRNNVCGIDLYYPHSSLLNTLNSCLVGYAKYLRPKWLLKRSLKRVYELIKKEIQNTDYLCIAPVNNAMCAIVTCIEEGPDSVEFGRFVDKFKEVLFLGPQGMLVMGTNGVQVWDCAFYIQSIFAANLEGKPEFYENIVRAYRFLCRSQFTTECVPGSYRDPRVGAWPFSTKTQGYTVSDCTAEAAKSVLLVRNSPVFKEMREEISSEKLQKAMDVLLSLQNVGTFQYGSFASYEKIRAPLSIESLNSAEVFANIMVEYPYVECTDSSVLGLSFYRKYHDYRKDEVDHAIEIAVKFIKSVQEKDGSWYGCWGICYTYAGMFALEALHNAGESYANSETVKKGCDFLVSKQLQDGGWSETMKSSELHTYVSDKRSYVVQTAWALIGLLLADYPDRNVIDRGIELLKKRQLPSGEWKYESIEGVFNHSCAIEYPSYRFVFPIKALGIYSKKYGKDAV
ncbi:AaceriAGR351Wp [[Ashbya] aceris (nom. inval.)]|nr:AaceriAGR351Wp [[Ashbya] aceris (nom. inval.)]